VDIVVNNAGVGTPQSLGEGVEKIWLSIRSKMFLVLLRVANAFSKH
jgi:hypothetical protein